MKHVVTTCDICNEEATDYKEFKTAVFKPDGSLLSSHFEVDKEFHICKKCQDYKYAELGISKFLKMLVETKPLIRG